MYQYRCIMIKYFEHKKKSYLSVCTSVFLSFSPLLNPRKSQLIRQREGEGTTSSMLYLLLQNTLCVAQSLLRYVPSYGLLLMQLDSHLYGHACGTFIQIWYSTIVRTIIIINVMNKCCAFWLLLERIGFFHQHHHSCLQ